MSRANRRALRTLAQLVVSAGFTAAVAVIVQGLTATQAAAVLAGAQLLVTWGQNYLEAKDLVPELLPPPGPKRPPVPISGSNERWITGRLADDEGNQPQAMP